MRSTATTGGATKGSSGAPHRGSSSCTWLAHSSTRPAVAARPGEHDLGPDAAGHLHPERLEPVERRGQVGDLHRDRVHAATEPLHEPRDRRSVTEGGADLDRVVADPDHPAVAPHRRLGLLAVHHPGTEQPGQRLEDRVVVGPHRGGVEHPAHVAHVPNPATSEGAPGASARRNHRLSESSLRL